MLMIVEVTSGQHRINDNQPADFNTSEAVYEQGPEMPAARMWHHAVVLPNGNVALIGGITTGFTSLGSVEIYFPAADSFATYQMRHTHASPAIAKMHDGRYLIAGGSANMGVPRYAQTEIFDPEQMTFTEVGQMVRFRASGGSAVLSNGEVMIASAWWRHNDAHTYGEVFDLETNSFSAIGPFSISRSHGVVIPTSDAQAMLMGGFRHNGEWSNMPVELYNPSNGEISTLHTSLVPGEAAWTIMNSEALTSNQLLANGSYLWMALRPWPGVTSFKLVTINPVSKEIAAVELDTELPDSHSYYFIGQPVIDNVKNRAYLLAVVMGTGSYQIAVFTVDLENGSLTKSSNYHTLSTYQLRSTPAVLLEDGRIFVAGGSVSNNFDAVNNTLFITPPEPAPSTSLPYSGLPSGLALYPNYPNPFNPATVIRYELPEPGNVMLEVYSVAGQRLSVLFDGHKAAGNYSQSFNAGTLASGVYLYRLTVGSQVLTRKMILMK